jgi:hypothetical protein
VNLLCRELNGFTLYVSGQRHGRRVAAEVDVDLHTTSRGITTLLVLGLQPRPLDRALDKVGLDRRGDIIAVDQAQ